MAIKLREILIHPQSTEPATPVQIVMPEDDWGDFVEVSSKSSLLNPFLDWEVESLSAEMATKKEWGAVLRIAIVQGVKKDE